jgi:TrmH family RNA methyltransferase
MPRQITGFSNELVKRVRSLRDKKHRRREGLFLAEGLRILTEAREEGALPEMLFFAPEGAAHPLAQMLIAETETTGGDVIETTPDILSKLSGKENAQTLVGVYRDRLVPLDRIDRAGAEIWIVAQALRDPGNLGTILRTSDAVGGGGLILIDDCVDPFSVEAVRASMGALFTQTVAAARWAEFLAWLRSGPGQLVGTSLRTEIDYQAARYATPTFILVGNEAQGLPEPYERACDLLVKMPMLGKADSLNAAVATAVMAYEVLNQRRSAP